MKRAWVNMGASPHTPYYITIVGYCKKKGPAARTSYASMRPLAKWPAASRVETANCAFLSIGWGVARGLASSMFPTFGCGLLVEKTAFLLSTVGRAYGWLPNVITKSCGQDNLIIMRILLLASHNLCQHVFSDKLIAGDANGDSNFHTIANRVRKGHG